MNVDSLADATTVFSRTDKRNGLIPLVLIPAERGFKLWITVPDQCHVLAQKWGKAIEKPVAAGGQFKAPGFRIAYLVTRQSCTYNAPIKACPTQDNVRVSIACQIIFSVRNPHDFVYKLGAVHFDQLLAGSVEEGIRHMVRMQTHKDIRQLRSTKSDGLVADLNGKFDAFGVVFTSVTIMDVGLPASLVRSLEQTTTMNTKMARVITQHDYDKKQIEQELQIDLQTFLRQTEEARVKEGGKKQQAEMKHKANMVKADEQLKVAMIEINEKSQVKRLELQSQLERTMTDMERLRVQTMSVAEASVETKRVEADNEYYKAQADADAERERLLGESEAIKLDMEAEAKAAIHLTHKRQHELDMREKDVIMTLARKTNFNLIGKHGDKMVNAVLAGSVG